MPRNDNAHALRLLESLRITAGEDTALAFTDAHPLSKSADADKKYSWACDVCHALEEQFSPDEASAIRRACRCGDGKTMAREISACIQKSGDIAEGCRQFSQKSKYAFLEYVSDYELLFGYHACVCSCIKRADSTVPLLWCECSAGYAEGMFRLIFGDTVHVSLLSSAKSGAARCTFRVQW